MSGEAWCQDGLHVIWETSSKVSESPQIDCLHELFTLTRHSHLPEGHLVKQKMVRYKLPQQAHSSLPCDLHPNYGVLASCLANVGEG